MPNTTIYKISSYVNWKLSGTGVVISGGGGSVVVPPKGLDGSGLTNQVAFWVDTDTLTGDDGFIYEVDSAGTGVLGVNYIKGIGDSSGANSVLYLHGDSLFLGDIIGGCLPIAESDAVNVVYYDSITGKLSYGTGTGDNYIQSITKDFVMTEVSITISDNFEAYTAGQLVGKGPWYGNGIGIEVYDDILLGKTIGWNGEGESYYAILDLVDLVETAGFDFSFEIVVMSTNNTNLIYIGNSTYFEFYCVGSTYGAYLYIYTENSNYTIWKDPKYVAGDVVMIRRRGLNITMYKNGVIDTDWYEQSSGDGSGDAGEFVLGSDFNWDGDNRLWLGMYDYTVRLDNFSISYNIGEIALVDGVHLVNDEDNPGNQYYYGTDASGTKGWYDLPSDSLWEEDSLGDLSPITVGAGITVDGITIKNNLIQSDTSLTLRGSNEKIQSPGYAYAGPIYLSSGAGEIAYKNLYFGDSDFDQTTFYIGTEGIESTVNLLVMPKGYGTITLQAGTGGIMMGGTTGNNNYIEIINGLRPADSGLTQVVMYDEINYRLYYGDGGGIGGGGGGTTTKSMRIALQDLLWVPGGVEPTPVGANGTWNSLEYTINDYSYFSFAVPSDWEEGTDIEVKIYWFINEAGGSGQIIGWYITYGICPADESIDIQVAYADYVESGAIDIPTISRSLATTSLILDSTYITADTNLGIELGRYNNSWTSPTDEPKIVDIQIIYTSSSGGGGGGGGVTLSGSTNNTVCTVTGADAIQGEANLTYDGIDLTNAAGNMYADDFVLNSDIKLKQNIELYKPQFLDIEYKQFELKNNPEQKRFGVIAQDLQKVCPELIHDNLGYLSVSYIDLLIREVAYLKEEIKKLK